MNVTVWTPEQIRQMTDAVQKAINDMEAMLRAAFMPAVESIKKDMQTASEKTL